MAAAQSLEPPPRKPLRVWPGVAAVIVQWIGWFVAPVVLPDAGMAGMLAAVAMTLAIIVWWLFFSRAPWPERIGVIALMVVAVFVTLRVVHQSIAGRNDGADVADLRHYSAGPRTRRGSPGGPGPFGCRTLGVDARGDRARVRRVHAAADRRHHGRGRGSESPGGGRQRRRNGCWRDRMTRRHLRRPRRTPAPTTPEVSKEQPPTKPARRTIGGGRCAAPAVAATAAPPVAMPKPDWPGFRGPERDGVIHGVRIDTDWSASPPAKLWSRPIGPGWSSFAVRGDLLYTQEQRGDDEVVACYKVSTGAPVWRHRDPARFWESNGGAGPRGYADPRQRSRLHARCDRDPERAGRPRPAPSSGRGTPPRTPRRRLPAGASRARRWWWATSSSSAPSGKLAGYDIATGKPRWTGRPARRATAHRTS